MRPLALLFIAAAVITPAFAQVAGIDYPTPEQIAAQPRYILPPGEVAVIPTPLPVSLRAQTERVGPEVIPDKPIPSLPRFPAPVIDSNARFQVLADPFAGHPRPDTVTSITRIENATPQPSNPTVAQVRGQ